jgi:hypothetical protein
VHEAMNALIDNPAGRQLVQRLSVAAVLVDKAVSGPPPFRAPDGIDYAQRQRQSEHDARRELKKLREALCELALD